MNKMTEFDAVIIGGGPAGYVAAVQLAKGGAKTCLIEADTLGGTCLNYGCIPTKALYYYAKTLHALRKDNGKTLKLGSVDLDFQAVMEDKGQTVRSLVDGVKTLIEKNKISYIRGYGRLVDKQTVEVSDKDGKSTQEVSGKYILIATGSVPIIPPIEGLKNGQDQGNVLTSKDILDIKEIPKSLAVIGGGVIGMEFATIFNQFGTKVTVIEAQDSILMNFNKELVKRYKPLAKKQGIDIITGARVNSVATKEDQVEVVYETKKGTIMLSCEKVLCAVGRKPNLKDIENNTSLDSLHDGKKVIADDHMRTAVDHIYAIGDINGKSLLAHSASKQGLIAADDILLRLEKITEKSENRGFSEYAVPKVAFLIPELSEVSIGVGDEKDKRIKTGKFPFRANGMALSHHETDGLCKVLVDEQTNKLLYMGILGIGGSELVQIGTVQISNNIDYNHLIDDIASHPSLSEIVHEALMDAKGKSIHQY